MQYYFNNTLYNMSKTIITGEEFNEKYKGHVFYKLFKKDLTNFKYTYVDGLNVDLNNFNQNNIYSSKLDFYDKNNISCYLSIEDCFITTISIPNDANVCVKYEKFISDKLIIDITNKITIKDFCKNAVEINPYTLKYVNEQTEELCKFAVSRECRMLKYVKEQNEELCKIAVSRNGIMLKYVKEQTEELCKIAVKQNGYALKYVHEQTNEISKLAIQHNCEKQKNHYLS